MIALEIDKKRRWVNPLSIDDVVKPRLVQIRPERAVTNQ